MVGLLRCQHCFRWTWSQLHQGIILLHPCCDVPVPWKDTLFKWQIILATSRRRLRWSWCTRWKFQQRRSWRGWWWLFGFPSWRTLRRGWLRASQPCPSSPGLGPGLIPQDPAFRSPTPSPSNMIMIWESCFFVQPVKAWPGRGVRGRGLRPRSWWKRRVEGVWAKWGLKAHWRGWNERARGVVGTPADFSAPPCLALTGSGSLSAQLPSALQPKPNALRLTKITYVKTSCTEYSAFPTFELVQFLLGWNQTFNRLCEQVGLR